MVISIYFIWKSVCEKWVWGLGGELSWGSLRVSVSCHRPCLYERFHPPFLLCKIYIWLFYKCIFHWIILISFRVAAAESVSFCHQSWMITKRAAVTSSQSVNFFPLLLHLHNRHHLQQHVPLLVERQSGSFIHTQRSIQLVHVHMCSALSRVCSVFRKMHALCSCVGVSTVTFLWMCCDWW